MTSVGRVQLFNPRVAQHQATALRNPALALNSKLDILRNIISGKFTYDPAALKLMRPEIEALRASNNQELAQSAAQAFDKLFGQAPANPPQPPAITPPAAPPEAPESSTIDLGELSSSAVVMISAKAISGGQQGSVKPEDVNIPTVAAMTAVGSRTNNEDGLLVAGTRDIRFLLVADGMGGHAKGEEASHIMIETAEEAFTNDPNGFLMTSIDSAQSPFLLAHERINRELTECNPGTTVVAALLRGNDLRVKHYGDSRAYVLRASSGELEQLTVDDCGALMSDFLGQRNKGQVLSEAESRRLHQLSRDARGTNAANLIQAIGHEIYENQPEVRTTLEDGDILLLTSDGAHDFIGSFDQLKQVVVENQDKSPFEISQAVYEAALAATPNDGSEGDNITVAVHVHGYEPDPEISVGLSNLGATADQAVEQAGAIMAQLNEVGLVELVSLFEAVQAQTEYLASLHRLITTELARLATQRKGLESDSAYAEEQIQALEGDPVRQTIYQEMRSQTSKALQGNQLAINEQQEELDNLAQRAEAYVAQVNATTLNEIGEIETILGQARSGVESQLEQIRLLFAEDPEPATTSSPVAEPQAKAPAPPPPPVPQVEDLEPPTNVLTPPDQEATKITDPQVLAILSSNQTLEEMRDALEGLADNGNPTAAAVLLEERFNNLA